MYYCVPDDGCYTPETLKSHDYYILMCAGKANCFLLIDLKASMRGKTSVSTSWAAYIIRRSSARAFQFRASILERYQYIHI